jgi:hypothetical protein
LEFSGFLERIQMVEGADIAHLFLRGPSKDGQKSVSVLRVSDGAVLNTIELVESGYTPMSPVFTETGQGWALKDNEWIARARKEVEMRNIEYFTDTFRITLDGPNQN